MKDIKNEIIREQLSRMKRNLIPSLTVSIIAMLLSFVCLAYTFKVKLGLNSLVESMQIVSTSFATMLGIIIIGCIVFTICLILEDN